MLLQTIDLRNGRRAPGEARGRWNQVSFWGTFSEYAVQGITLTAWDEMLPVLRFAREVQGPGDSCGLPSTVLFGRVKWKRILDGIPSRLATLRYTSACRRYFSASTSTCSGSTACVLKSTIKPSGFPGR